jgi:hypothetical protein
MKWILHTEKPKKTTKQVEQQIIRKYAYMFPKQDTSKPGWSPIVFGFEVGNGWAELLENIFNVIGALDTNKTLIIDQIKEKFGTLRFYYSHIGTIDDKTADLISWVVRCGENESGYTCERCGAPAKVESVNHWLSCMCKSCAKEVKRDQS